MSSIVEICNMALASIRGKSINSLTEASIEAQQCKLHYDIARQFVLRDTPWGFAKKTAVLQLRNEKPLEWLYAYQYPIDCLYVRKVVADFGFNEAEFANRKYYEDFVLPENEYPFEVLESVDGKSIGTDLEEAYVVYTKNITNPTMFGAQFVRALVHYLGSMIAVPIMGGDIGRTMRGDELELYRATISSAVASNMNESKPHPRKDAALVNARR